MFHDPRSLATENDRGAALTSAGPRRADRANAIHGRAANRRGESCYNFLMEERIIELETLAAYQAKLLSELNEVLQEIAKRVENVEKRVGRVENAQIELQDSVEPDNTPPPHY